MAMRLARSGCGSVNYWMGLPIPELMAWLMELHDQLREEQKAEEEASRR